MRKYTVALIGLGPVDAMKLPKAVVNYRPHQPNAGCGWCEHYERHGCTKVRGVINSDMMCDLFEPE